MQGDIPTQPDRGGLSVLASYLQPTMTYHNHKESMAYNAATLYVAASSALILTKPFWCGYSTEAFIMFIVLLIGIAAMALFYVRWQLSMRRDAAVRFGGCTNLAAAWVKSEPCWITGPVMHSRWS
jgi:hypothetical protein